jgi:Na+/H+-dicarboxylate symporter
MKQRKVSNYQPILWIVALVVGAIMGLLGLDWINGLINFVATVYIRLFQLLAVPTIVLAVITTFATFGSERSGRIFGRTLIYTLLTISSLVLMTLSPTTLIQSVFVP